MAASKPVRRIEDYADIINLPHPVPTVRPPMPMSDRAAQFSPYAALVGYGDLVAETARLTDDEIELSDSQTESLDRKLQIIQEAVAAGHPPEITVTYFVPDSRKTGGAYQTHTGSVKRIDTYERTITFTDHKSVPITSIIEIVPANNAGMTGEV